MGATIGKNANIHPTVKITIPWNISIGEHAAIGDSVILYALGPINIGKRATVSQYAHICAGSHDCSDPLMRLTKPSINIEKDAWVCADAFVGPGVTIGASAIVGARGVVTKDVAPGTVVAGNPAQVIGSR